MCQKSKSSSIQLSLHLLRSQSPTTNFYNWWWWISFWSLGDCMFNAGYVDRVCSLSKNLRSQHGVYKSQNFSKCSIILSLLSEIHSIVDVTKVQQGCAYQCYFCRVESHQIRSTSLLCVMVSHNGGLLLLGFAQLSLLGIGLVPE